MMGGSVEQSRNSVTASRTLQGSGLTSDTSVVGTLVLLPVIFIDELPDELRTVFVACVVDGITPAAFSMGRCSIKAPCC
jgi:hypothetical protein